MSVLPKYPVYVPTKDRADTNLTAKCLLRDGVPFHLVVEKGQRTAYQKALPDAKQLVLPHEGRGLFQARNWIKRHAARAGHARHWQLDDNIRKMYRRHKAMRIPCEAGIALAACERFTDRYENVAISGLNYHMFGMEHAKMPPFYVNAHVYSCTLVLTRIPQRWRLLYNDDTDICLQVLSDGWCTILMNAFLCGKVASMQLSGGNTDTLYQGDGRLKMARALERMWPGVVRTTRRFQRPQHCIDWSKFDTPLKRRPEAEIAKLTLTDADMGLEQVRPEVKSGRLRRLLGGARERSG